MMALWEGCRVGRRGPDEARSDAPLVPSPPQAPEAEAMPLRRHASRRRAARQECRDWLAFPVVSAGSSCRASILPISPHLPICPSAHLPIHLTPALPPLLPPSHSPDRRLPDKIAPRPAPFLPVTTRTVSQQTRESPPARADRPRQSPPFCPLEPRQLVCSTRAAGASFVAVDVPWNRHHPNSPPPR